MTVIPRLKNENPVTCIVLLCWIVGCVSMVAAQAGNATEG